MRLISGNALVLAAAVLAVCVRAGEAGQSAAQARTAPVMPTGVVQPPQPPAVVTRSPEGVTIRAVRIAEPIAIDGRIDEGVYRDTLPIDGFIQQEPTEGAPATEKTEVWLLFDDNNVYISAKCYDSQPHRMVADELRKDSSN